MSFSHLLIPTDGSDEGQRAAHAGIDLAAVLKAQVTLITVFKSYHLVSLDPLVGLAPDEEWYLDTSRRMAKTILKVGEDHAFLKGVKLRPVLVYDDHPWRAIVEEARANGCDLIHMAAYGTKSRASLLIGSETAKVLTHATIPVLAYR